MEFIFEPYLAVGNIKFGMNREEIENLFIEKPIFETVDFRNRIHLGWSDFSILFNKKKLVTEITFTSGKSNKVLWNDIDILNDPNITKKLNKYEKPTKGRDVKLYSSLGIALIGNSKERTLSLFDKETGEKWKNLILKYSLK